MLLVLCSSFDFGFHYQLNHFPPPAHFQQIRCHWFQANSPWSRENPTYPDHPSIKSLKKNDEFVFDSLFAGLIVVKLLAFYASLISCSRSPVKNMLKLESLLPNIEWEKWMKNDLQKKMRPRHSLLGHIQGGQLQHFCPSTCLPFVVTQKDVCFCF